LERGFYPAREQIQSRIISSRLQIIGARRSRRFNAQNKSSGQFQRHIIADVEAD
jgi:hypothetical protein